jgi:hypothetical protein
MIHHRHHSAWSRLSGGTRTGWLTSCLLAVLLVSLFDNWRKTFSA